MSHSKQVMSESFTKLRFLAVIFVAAGYFCCVHSHMWDQIQAQTCTKGFVKLPVVMPQLCNRKASLLEQAISIFTCFL